jgi:hypothetical protein
MYSHLTELQRKPLNTILALMLLTLAILVVQACGYSDKSTDDHLLDAPTDLQTTRRGACQGAALVHEINTLGELIDKLGAPDKVYRLIFRLPHESQLRTVQLLYLHLGVDFEICGYDKALRRDISVRVHDCYMPTDLEAHKIRKDGLPTGRYEHRGNHPSHVDWTGFDK